MITTYDLASFSTIEVDQPVTPESIHEFVPAAELRLETVAESISSMETPGRDFSGVIAAQVLAVLSA